MTPRAAFLVAAALCAGLCAAPAAHALPWCDEEGAHHDEESDAPPVVDSLPVVPCAMVESGLLGPACGDATFYVVTDSGVTLCSVDIDTFALTTAPTRSVETMPAAPTTPSAFGFPAFALAPSGAALPLNVARDLVAAVPVHSGEALDRPRCPAVPPS